MQNGYIQQETINSVRFGICALPCAFILSKLAEWSTGACCIRTKFWFRWWDITSRRRSSWWTRVALSACGTSAQAHSVSRWYPLLSSRSCSVSRRQHASALHDDQSWRRERFFSFFLSLTRSSSPAARRATCTSGNTRAPRFSRVWSSTPTTNTCFPARFPWQTSRSRVGIRSRTLATTSADRSIKLWDLDTMEVTKLIGHEVREVHYGMKRRDMCGTRRSRAIAKTWWVVGTKTGVYNNRLFGSYLPIVGSAIGSSDSTLHRTREGRGVRGSVRAILFCLSTNNRKKHIEVIVIATRLDHIALLHLLLQRFLLHLHHIV